MASSRARSIYIASILIAAIILSAQAYLSLVVAEAPSDGGGMKGVLYSYYDGVGLFSKGIHVVATDVNPVESGQRSPIYGWRELYGWRTSVARETQFISLLVSRGDLPTGGFTINITSMELSGKQFLLSAEFVDPGEGVMVTEAFTNPAALVPLGRLPPGNYSVRLHIDLFHLVVREDGAVEKVPILTFMEVVWRAEFTVIPAGELPGEEASRIATEFLKGTSTFSLDGLEHTVEVVDVQRHVDESEPHGYSWVVTIDYITGHPGHGDRAGEILLEVLTSHRAVVTVSEVGVVEKAVCDGIWDLINDVEVSAALPAATRFTVVVNEGRRFDLSVDVDLGDGVSKGEAEVIGERVFVAVLGSEVLRRLDSISLEKDLITIHYTWGFNEQDLAHFLEAVVDPSSLTIRVTHCR